MARTRGVSTYRDKSSTRGETRRRPTTSARRGRTEEVDVDVHEEHDVTKEQAKAKMTLARGPKVRLSWLRDVYHECYWIYEQFHGMGRRHVMPTYDENNPCMARWVKGNRAWSLLEDMSYLGGMAYDRVILCLYESHRGTRPFMVIYMYSRWIRLGEMLHQHFPKRVLRQFDFEQLIPRSPQTITEANTITIDGTRLCYVDHVITHVVPTSSPSACVARYL
ncbi:hypothetical protein LR48_Vigan07g249100 [Vigna angularis]|uniref:Aminotransferase-like plant mobile domain-containing protein n=1 Tax=Phaseolus angularis TaxID=3914 RepID=A0A0L9V1N8_PHAAN|nr:hypothetical protein LR48_Vigan07g249100 [Vigna angularis]